MVGLVQGAMRGWCETSGVVLESGVTEERPQPGQGSVRNKEMDCEEVGAGGVGGEAGSRAGREDKGVRIV